jgi:hypothetical protein
MTALAALALLALIFGTAYTVELAMRRREEKAVMRFIQQEMNERASRLEQAKQAFLDAQLASVELEESDTTAEERTGAPQPSESSHPRCALRGGDGGEERRGGGRT